MTLKKTIKSENVDLYINFISLPVNINTKRKL